MAFLEPDKPKYKRGETVIGVTTEKIGGTKIDFVVVGTVKDYYPTGGVFGYIIKVCKILFHGKSSFYNNLTKEVSLHRGWIEEVPYHPEIAEQIDNLIYDTPYLDLWKKLSGRKPKIKVKLI
jgi:hypothetical protein